MKLLPLCLVALLGVCGCAETQTTNHQNDDSVNPYSEYGTAQQRTNEVTTPEENPVAYNPSPPTEETKPDPQAAVRSAVDAFYRELVPLLVQHAGDYDDYWAALTGPNGDHKAAYGCSEADRYRKTIQEIEQVHSKADEANAFPELRNLTKALREMFSYETLSITYLTHAVKYQDMAAYQQANINRDNAVDGVTTVMREFEKINRKYGLGNYETR